MGMALLRVINDAMIKILVSERDQEFWRAYQEVIKMMVFHTH